MMTDLQIAGNTVFGVLIKKRLHFNLKVLSKIFKKNCPSLHIYKILNIFQNGVRSFEYEV
jgi:hypothetical protein